MSRIRISKSRLAAAVVLIAILVVGILFPVSGSNAKYTTQTTLRGSVSYMLDNSLATGFTLTGADNEWRTERIPVLPGFSSNFFLKFYFAQGGIEIKSARLIITKDLEEEFRKRFANL